MENMSSEAERLRTREPFSLSEDMSYVCDDCLLCYAIAAKLAIIRGYYFK
uniref:Uncharacterized protein n=1 Tax=Anguilla anguilla TaxID=7936 RepID=A0A0E9PXX4_ANGAN